MSNNTCASCSAQLDPNGSFCPACGASITATAAPTPPPAMPYQPPVAQQPVYQASAGNNAAAPVLSVGSYIGMMLLACIPLVGFILLLVWAFSSGENPNKKNYARAVLVISLIGVGLGILLTVITGGALYALLAQLSY